MFPISRQVMYFMLLLGGSWFSPLVGSPCLKPYLVLKTQLEPLVVLTSRLKASFLFSYYGEY